MGIAISLCQTLGLNRDPDRGHYNKNLSDRQRQLWRRIWWSKSHLLYFLRSTGINSKAHAIGCFYRDRWLSFAMGRPMRINAWDCDTPMPSAEDLTDDVSELPPRIQAIYMPDDFSQLANQWIVLLHLSKALGSILYENYSPTRQLPSRAWIEATEEELSRCIIKAGEQPVRGSPALSFYFYHLQLHFK